MKSNKNAEDQLVQDLKKRFILTIRNITKKGPNPLPQKYYPIVDRLCADLREMVATSSLRLFRARYEVFADLILQLAENDKEKWAVMRTVKVLDIILYNDQTQAVLNSILSIEEDKHVERITVGQDADAKPKDEFVFHGEPIERKYLLRTVELGLMDEDGQWVKNGKKRNGKCQTKASGILKACWTEAYCMKIHVTKQWDWAEIMG